MRYSSSGGKSYKARQSFGSFHSDDIEMLVRLDTAELQRKLPKISEILAEETKSSILSSLQSIVNHDKSRQRHFALDDSFTFLNHGAFGAALKPLLYEANQWRLYCESQPLRFFDRELFALISSSLHAMANLLNCHPHQLMPLPNVTTGLNAICRSIPLSQNDEVVVLSLTYGSTKKIMQDWCNRQGATLLTVALPLPLTSYDEITSVIEKSIGSKTKVVILDQITSNTAIELPICQISAAIKRVNPNVSIVVDAAHSLFALPITIYTDIKLNKLNQDFENIDFWLSNCHKWMSCPKGSAVMWVSPRVKNLHPAIVSHGYIPQVSSNFLNAIDIEPGKFLSSFAWDGCRDYASLLTWPSAISCWDLLAADFRDERKNNSGLQHEEWNFCRDYIRKLLDQAEGALIYEWQLNEEDFPSPHYMRKASPMRLVNYYN